MKTKFVEPTSYMSKEMQRAFNSAPKAKATKTVKKTKKTAKKGK